MRIAIQNLLNPINQQFFLILLAFSSGIISKYLQLLKKEISVKTFLWHIVYNSSETLLFFLFFPYLLFSALFYLLCSFFTVWKLRKFTLTLLWQKFRESNTFAKELTTDLISRNIFSVKVNFLIFHTVVFFGFLIFS